MAMAHEINFQVAAGSNFYGTNKPHIPLSGNRGRGCVRHGGGEALGLYVRFCTSLKNACVF